MPPTQAPQLDTKERILDASERLFAEMGFDAASLRAITAEAGVNVAAVNYHFGSKDGLIESVFRRRLTPLNEERLALLDSLEEADGSPSAEAVLEAFVGPPLRLHQDLQRGGPMFMRLMGRTITEPSPRIQEIMMRQFAELARRFGAALQRALPDLPDGELFWRMHFSIGALAHTMCDTFRLKLISGGRADNRDVDATIRRLVAFLAAGFRASAGTARRRGRKR
jgi:AcrR family transcriptional regulator